MSEINSELNKHTLCIEDRKMLQVSGIKDVAEFNEEAVTAQCDFGDLLIKGEKLHVESLDLDTGTLKVSGNIIAVVYNEKSQAKGFFKRAFS